ncbi:MAG: DUF1800 domain-containing protein [Terracidiphilus sp.]|jgi:uncharacterized protein (DUF1800 family)
MLVAQPSPSQSVTTPLSSSSHTEHRSAQALSDDERILHALSRFTFGPRPGDLERVREIGLDRWFELQLQPATMDYTDLYRRLNEFPAMSLSAQQLLIAFPSGAIIRQTAEGKLPMPNTPILHTVYNDQIASLREREAKKAEKEKEAVTAPIKDPLPATQAMPSGQEMGVEAKSGAIEMAKPQGAIDAQRDSEMASGELMANRIAAKPASEVIGARPSPEEVEVDAILALPPKQRVSRLLAMTPQELENLRQELKGPQRELLIDRMTAGEREVVADLENPSNAVINEMKEQRLTRDLYSPAQLQEVMTDFWLNHFNVFLHKNEETPYYLVSFERDVIRPHALGKFEDLLVATAESPAMMLYLDNASSMGPDSVAAEKDKERAQKQNKPAPPSGLNENYARELMELHTLGVDGGYTQHDVTEMARVFTGWTVDRPARGGGFFFDERKHEPGTKKILGEKVRDGGMKEGLEMLHRLAMRPATAQFVSRKLAIRFVSDDPPQSLVNRMARSYLASSGDIAAVLRTMFHSPELWQRDAYRAKVKTPLEYVVSAARASDARTDHLMQLSYALDRMGMPLYGCVPPTGYSSNAKAWVNSGALVNRMNFALNLAANKLPGIQTEWLPDADDSDLAREVAGDAAQTDMATDELSLENRLIQSQVSSQTRKTLLEEVESQADVRTEVPKSQSASAQPIDTAAQTMGKRTLPKQFVGPTARDRQDALMAGLLLGSPEFQRR